MPTQNMLKVVFILFSITFSSGLNLILWFVQNNVLHVRGMSVMGHQYPGFCTMLALAFISPLGMGKII